MRRIALVFGGLLLLLTMASAAAPDASRAFVVGDPWITSLSPDHGPVGSLVTITGSAFGTEGDVYFCTEAGGSVGAAKAPQESRTDTQIVCRVPPGISQGTQYVWVTWVSPEGVPWPSNSFEFTVDASVPPKIVVTNPTASSSWPSGSTRSITWTANPAVSNGEFRVGLLSAAGTALVSKQVLPVADKINYALALAASVPAGTGYRAFVYWRPTAGSGTWTVQAKSAAFTVTPLNITSPTATSTWATGSTQNVTWTMNPAVSAGEFRVWLVTPAGLDYATIYIRAVAGKTSYAQALKLACPSGSGYTAHVSYRPTIGSGAYTATATSAVFRVMLLNVTAPTAASSWPSGSRQTISWTMNPAAPAGGEFRLRLFNTTTSAWYLYQQVLPVAGRTSYSAPVTAAAPAGTYRAYVYYRAVKDVGGWTVVGVSPAFKVTPLNVTTPTAASSWPSGSRQTMSWTMNPAAPAGGEFRLRLFNTTTSAWYLYQQVLPVAGRTSYSAPVTAAAPAGTYRAYVYYRAVKDVGGWTVVGVSPAFKVTP